MSKRNILNKYSISVNNYTVTYENLFDVITVTSIMTVYCFSIEMLNFSEFFMKIVYTCKPGT